MNSDDEKKESFESTRNSVDPLRRNSLSVPKRTSICSMNQTIPTIRRERKISESELNFASELTTRAPSRALSKVPSREQSRWVIKNHKLSLALFGRGRSLVYF